MSQRVTHRSHARLDRQVPSSPQQEVGFGVMRRILLFTFSIVELATVSEYSCYVDSLSRTVRRPMRIWSLENTRVLAPTRWSLIDTHVPAPKSSSVTPCGQTRSTAALRETSGPPSATSAAPRRRPITVTALVIG